MHFIFLDPADLTEFLLAQGSVLEEITLRHCVLVKNQWSNFLSNTFSGTDWNSTITLARLAEWNGDRETAPSSVLFDTDHLLDCCSLGADDWSSIRERDCKHVNRTLKPKDLLNLKITVVDRSDPKHKEDEENSKRRLEEAMAKRVAEGTLSQERVDRIMRISNGELTDEDEDEDGDDEEDEDSEDSWDNYWDGSDEDDDEGNV